MKKFFFTKNVFALSSVFVLVAGLIFTGIAEAAPPSLLQCPANVTVNATAGTCSACTVNLYTPVPSPVTLNYYDRMITYTGVSVNGGSNAAVVAPGSSVSLAYSLSVAFDIIYGYCPGCVVQSYIGIGGLCQTLQCEDGIYGDFTDSYNSGNFTAPSTPGIYYITQEGSLDFQCNAVCFNNLPANAIAVILVGLTNDAPSCFNAGVTTVTWTGIDGSSNISTCTQTVTVIDDEDPVITCPANITVNTDSGSSSACIVLSAATIASPVTLSYADRMITYTGVSLNGAGNSAVVAQGSSVSLAYSLSVAFDVINGYCPSCDAQSYIGIGGTCQTLQCENLIDNGFTDSYNSGNFTAPSTPGTYYLTQEGSLDYQCNAVCFTNVPANAIGVIQVGALAATATDNCSKVTVTSDAPSCFNLGATTVTWTATDSSGNSITCTQTVTVVDNEAPVITRPSDITVNAHADSCSACIVLSAATIASPVTLSYYDRMITYTGVSLNGAGNSAVVAPGSSVSLAYSLSVAFDVINGYCPYCEAQSYIGIGGMCQTLQCEDGIDNGFTDSYNSGNFTAPSTPGTYYLTQEGTLDYYCKAVCFNNVPANAIGVIQVGSLAATATDNCGSVTITSDAPSCFSVGATTVTWTATDSSGNSNTCTQTITIVDNQAPVIATSPLNITQSGCTASAVTWTEPTATDNCSYTFTSNYQSGDIFPVGLTEVKYYASDAAGNKDSAMFTVNIDCPTLISETSTGSSLGLRAYPNPASGKLYVSFNTVSKEKYLLKVIDLIGQELVSKAYTSMQGANQNELDLGGVAKGSYFLRFESEGGVSRMVRISVN